ncbi:MAG TPA: DinB family protein, partial [Planctomycetota bacterium]|nr:DinB family protein [Planctomycetota bacterium]
MGGQPDGKFAVGFRDMVVKGQWPMEAKSTAEVIRRIPADKTGFKPHEKSMSAIDLAKHIVVSEGMFVDAIANGKFNFELEKKTAALPSDPKKLADTYAQWQEGAAAKLAKVSEADLLRQFSFGPPMPDA